MSYQDKTSNIIHILFDLLLLLEHDFRISTCILSYINYLNSYIKIRLINLYFSYN